MFSAGFIFDYEKFKDYDYNFLLSSDFIKYVKDNGKIYPGINENYYSVNSTQLNNIINNKKLTN